MHVLVDTSANRSAANWKFIEKIVELIVSLEPTGHSEDASCGTCQEIGRDEVLADYESTLPTSRLTADRVSWPIGAGYDLPVPFTAKGFSWSSGAICSVYVREKSAESFVRSRAVRRYERTSDRGEEVQE